MNNHRTPRIEPSLKCSIIITICAMLAIGCKARQPEAATTAAVAAAPSPTLQSTPARAPMTAREHWDAFNEIWDEKIYSPEDYAEARRHLTIVANSRMTERRRAAGMLKYLSNLEAMLPTGENLKQAQRMCADLSGAEISTLTEQLKKSLHDPSSLQDFKVDKFVPRGSSGRRVSLMASYRARNTYGALTLNEEQFLAVMSTDGKTKYKALVWVDEK